ncbi:MAG: Uma2 family endonuclease [Chloroflexota bacterium]|nr:Uma2 family endonuclease [Chloroflexota bacterium]
MATVAPPRPPPAAATRSPWEQFDALPDDTKAELIDGELVYAMPVNERHNATQLFIQTVLSLYVVKQGLGRVFADQFEMRLGLQRFVPDASFVRTEHLDRVLPTRIEGPADLVVEILSPDSVARDRGVKLRDYAAAGVQEYWLLDPETERIEVYARQPDGTFAPLAPDRTGAIASQVVPGLRLQPEWLWPGAGRPTDVLAALRAHGIG